MYIYVIAGSAAFAFLLYNGCSAGERRVKVHRSPVPPPNTPEPEEVDREETKEVSTPKPEEVDPVEDETVEPDKEETVTNGFRHPFINLDTIHVASNKKWNKPLKDLIVPRYIRWCQEHNNPSCPISYLFKNIDAPPHTFVTISFALHKGQEFRVPFSLEHRNDRFPTRDCHIFRRIVQSPEDYAFEAVATDEVNGSLVEKTGPFLSSMFWNLGKLGDVWREHAFHFLSEGRGKHAFITLRREHNGVLQTAHVYFTLRPIPEPVWKTIKG